MKDRKTNSKSSMSRLGYPLLNSIRRLGPFVVLVMFVLAAPSAGAKFCAGILFEASLDPLAFQSLTRASVGGEGSIVARLRGDQLAIGGSFERLPAPATRAALYQGQGIGVPGKAIAEMNPANASSGKLEGNVTLNASQIAALQLGHIYIRIDTGSAPEGAAWAWFLPALSDRQCKKGKR